MSVKVEVRFGDITKQNVDAIVNPANSFGSMGGGAAYAIKRAGGVAIEEEAIEKGPTPVGSAVATAAGRLPAKYVIHAPTMENFAQRIGRENVEKATYAALKLAEKLGISSVAFPGMGTGVGGVPKKDAAEAMVKTIKRFVKEEESALECVFLVAFDVELRKIFEVCVEDAGF